MVVPSFYDSNCKFSKVFLLSVWNESTNSVNYRYLVHNCLLTNMFIFARDEMSKVLGLNKYIFDFVQVIIKKLKLYDWLIS